METKEEVFISYSHDSVEHVQRVLELSNKLRSEGIDCVLDQYEISPDEGWPRWMDKKIRDAKYVLMICSELYYKRVMGEEKKGVGHGIRWEGNLIYQHLYNAGMQNKKFIPVIFDNSHAVFIPVPVQGATYYCVSTESGYNELYGRLTDQPKVEKPKLGKRRSLPKKTVKTDPVMYLTSPIDINLWDDAKWSATFFLYVPGNPPVLGLAYRNESAARKIFTGWHDRYGKNDEYEELRISIIEGEIKGEESGYSVHVSSDPKTAIKRFEDAGYEFDNNLLMSISRIQRMNPPPHSKNLENFKQLYRQYKTYYLAPGVVSDDGKQLKPMVELGIYKSKILFRKIEEIGDDDLDAVVLRSGEVKRSKNKWHKSSKPR